MIQCYFANRNELLRDSNRIEPNPRHIRNEIVEHHGWRKKNETSRVPTNQ